MADAAVDFLLNNLKDLLIDHLQLITKTKTHIMSLEGDLRKFKGFLKDSLKQRRKDEEMKALVRSIRDVVYDVEDVIDAFITEANEKTNKGRFYNFWKTPMELHNIGKMVAEVKAMVDKATTDLVNRKVVYDDEPRSDKIKYQVRPPTEKNVVGFEDVTEELIGRLTQETDDLEIVSLIGMLGLGKTTLAWKIYKDPRIHYKFPYRKWLTISQEFSNREIFLSILKDFTSITDDIHSKMDYELAHMVAEYLENESFLIVMDDVWTPTDWGSLSDALPKNNGKGKVLITSRQVEVGKYASLPRDPKELRFFKLEESWKLLRLEALGKLDCPDELEGVGKRIAENCKGLPLAVVVIGGMLATKFSSDTSALKKEWEKVATRVNLYTMDERSGMAGRMKNFICLSYDKLPYHLRSCFLYFGMFPEDYEIPVLKLFRMWIAEGFIQSNDSCNLEETAETYLVDLINRNLIQIKKFKPDGKIKTCGIHDALRDFCLGEAENEDENFLREIKFNDGVFQPPVDKLDKYRRLSIHSNCLTFISLQPFGPRVRSFVCFSKEEEGFTLPPENIPYILAAFKLLRVLDIKPITLPIVTTDIYQLVHVRYIVLSLKSSLLPPKFSNLWNIQTLIVDTTSSNLEVKADIWNMKYLRHFKTNVSATLPKPNKDSKHGAELQTLSTISLESCTTAVLAQAANLKKLGICGRLALLLEGKVGSFDTLGGMRNLEKLKLINHLDGRPASEGKLRGLPEAYQFPSNLKRLTLVATFLSWDSMYVLRLLGNLVVLKLKKNAFFGDTWSLKEVDMGFPCLEFLYIEETNLQVWTASPRNFPELKGLVLRNCGKLLGIPVGLANVASFQMLDLYVCGSAAQSAKDILEAKKQKPGKGSTFKLSIFPPIE